MKFCSTFYYKHVAPPGHIMGRKCRKTKSRGYCMAFIYKWHHLPLSYIAWYRKIVMNKRTSIKKRLLILFLLLLASVVVNYFRYTDDLKKGETHPASYWALQVLIVMSVFFAGLFFGFMNTVGVNLYKNIKKNK